MTVSTKTDPIGGVRFLSEKERQIEAPEDKTLLVVPKGYRVLVAIYQANRKTDGGIWKPDETIRREDHAQTIGYVIAMGPDCYSNKEQFPSGEHACQPGDYVMFRAYAGTRFRLEGTDTEFRLINDDAIEAVVVNPEKVRRAE